MDEWIKWIVQTASLLAIGTIAYFLKDIKKNTEDKIKDVSCNMEEFKKEVREEVKSLRAEASNGTEALRKEVNDFKEEIPMKYVLRDDFIRAMSNVDKQFDNVDKKLDKIYDTIVKKGCE